MDSRDEDGCGVVEKDGQLSIYAYTAQDVGRFLRAALDVTHAAPTPQPLCCIAAAGLLLTAAEMILRGPIAHVISDVNEAALRKSAVETADLLNHMTGPGKGVRH